MRIAHISDTHGTFPDLSEGDFVVHSGDILPNASRGNLEIEHKFQKAWVEDRIDTFKEWLGGRTLLFCQGNHDFIDPCEILNQNGVTAIDLTNKVVVHQGIVFYGFPYIPFFAGEWNHERHLQEMNNEIRYMLERIKDAQVNLDILVAHSPPWGICDLYLGEHFGSTLLTNLLSYEQLTPLPKYVLSGHIHECGGQIIPIFDTIVSNAATTINLIEFPLQSSNLL